MLEKLRLNETFTIGVLFSYLFGYYISFVLGVAVFMIVTLKVKQINIWGYIFFIYLISIVAFTNYSDVNTGDYDINRYYTYYKFFYDCRTLPELVLLLYESRDVLFYLIVWLSTFIFPSDPRWFGFIFTFYTTLLLFFAFKNFAKSLFVSDITRKCSSLLIFSLGFFFIIRFIDYTNGYRQHFAFALLLFFLSLNNIPKLTKYFLLLITCFVHTSNFVIVLIYYVVKHTRLYKNPKRLFAYSIIASFFCVSLLISLLGSNSYFVGYLMGDGALGRDNKIRLIMLIVSMLFTLFFAKVLSNSYQLENRKQQARDVINNLSIMSSTLLIISILFFSQSTMMIRYAFDLTDFIVVVSPIVYYLLKDKIAIQENISSIYFRGIGQYALKISWIFFSVYNFLKIGDGEFEYMIFSTYGIFSPIHNIINTITPEGLV